MKVTYKLADFTPVALIGKLPFTLMVAKSIPAKNLKELIDAAKAKPGQLNAGSGGPSGTTFFLLESLKKAAGLDIQSVPYKGTTDGVLRAYAAADGKQLWEYNTAHEYTTVNGVPGHGGSIDCPGPVIVNGMVYVESGYGSYAGMPGNVLLVFSVK